MPKQLIIVVLVVLDVGMSRLPRNTEQGQGLGVRGKLERISPVNQLDGVEDALGTRNRLRKCAAVVP